MICPGCTANNPDTATVCEYCGTALTMKAPARTQPAQTPQMRAPVQMSGNPLRVYCRNCGAPAGYDIINRTYRCTSCGTATGIKEARGNVENWKVLQKQSVAAMIT